MQRALSLAGHFATLLQGPQISWRSGSLSVPPGVPIAEAARSPFRTATPRP